MDSPELPLSQEVLLEHAAWVRRLAGELVRDPGAADDVAQETWLAFLVSRPSTDRPLRPWLARVLYNRAALRARRNAGRRARESEVARPEQIPSAEELVERAEVQRRLVEAVLSLQDPYRSTLLLRYYEGLTPAEIAAVRRLPPSTVRTHLFRGLEQLRERLDAEHGGDREAWAGLLVPLLVPATRDVAIGAGTAGWIAVGAALLAGLAWVGTRAWTGDSPASVGAEGVADATTGARTDTLGVGAGALEGAAPKSTRAAIDPVPAARAAGSTRALRLVDAVDGRALPDYTLRTDAGDWSSDAEGIVELPATVRRAVPLDDARLAVDVQVAHGVRVARALERDAIELAPPAVARGDAPADLVVPAGPTYRVDLVAPVHLDESRFEARLVAAGLSDYRDDGRPRQVAPLRPPGHGVERPWVRFGAAPDDALDPRARWSLQLADVEGLWFGSGAVTGADGTQVRDARVEVASTGVLAGHVDLGGAGAPRECTLLLHADHADGPLVRVTSPSNAGDFALRWIPPGEYVLAASADAHAPLEQRVTVRAGERQLVDVRLEPLPTSGTIAGVVVSESDAYAGQVLVFLLDASGGVLGVDPVTWKPRNGHSEAAFRFSAVPLGPVQLAIVSLADEVTAQADPSPLLAPCETVRVTLLDRRAASDWGFDVTDAATGLALARYEVEAQVDGGLARRFAGDRADAAAVDGGPAPLLWTRTAGGMRWNQFASWAPLRRLADDADLRWTVRAPGYRPASGGREAFVPAGPGRRVAAVALTPE